MPRPPKLRPDLNEIAFRTVQAATGQDDKPLPPGIGDKNAEAVRRGSKGGKRGGRARAAKLSKRRKTRIAKMAAKARWNAKRHS